MQCSGTVVFLCDGCSRIWGGTGGKNVKSCPFSFYILLFTCVAAWQRAAVMATSLSGLKLKAANGVTLRKQTLLVKATRSVKKKVFVKHLY